MKREDANKEARKGGENELAGSRSAARIQAKLRQMDRKDKRSSKR